MTSEPTTMLVLVRDPVDLRRPPAPEDLGSEHELRRSTPGTVLASGAAGLVLGAFGAATGLTPASLTLGSPVVLGAAVALALVVVLPLRRVAARLDARVALSVAAATVGAVTAFPPAWAAHLGGRFVLGAVAALLAWLALQAWRQVRRARADVLAWNDAYRRLAADARRAEGVRLSLRRESAGRAHRYTGTVEYTDASGRQRRVPLVSAPALQVLHGEDVVVKDTSPGVLWHTPDHSVVMTVLLADRAAV